LQGGAAQHVATALDARLRDHLKSRSNLFTESSSGLTISRPLLCLFDRNFELSVVNTAPLHLPAQNSLLPGGFLSRISYFLIFSVLDIIIWRMHVLNATVIAL